MNEAFHCWLQWRCRQINPLCGPFIFFFFFFSVSPTVKKSLAVSPQGHFWATVLQSSRYWKWHWQLLEITKHFVDPSRSFYYIFFVQHHLPSFVNLVYVSPPVLPIQFCVSWFFSFPVQFILWYICELCLCIYAPRPLLVGCFMPPRHQTLFRPLPCPLPCLFSTWLRSPLGIYSSRTVIPPWPH